MKKIEIVVIDDHALLREGLRNIINSQPDMLVVGEAESGSLGIDKIIELRPDAVIVDIALPDINGLEVACRIRNLNRDLERDIRVIILSMYGKENFVYRALEAGAVGYVPKDAPSSEIITAIRRAYEGKYYLSPEISADLVAEYLKGRKKSAPRIGYELLSEREQEVFRLTAEGHSSKRIASFLNISAKTVNKHRANIMAKLGIHGYREVVRYAILIGILDADLEDNVRGFNR